MKKFSADDVKVGSRFSLPVFFDQDRNMFVGENIPVTERDVAMLKHWNIKSLYTMGRMLGVGEAMPASDVDKPTQVEELPEEDLSSGDEVQPIDISINDNEKKVSSLSSMNGFKDDVIFSNEKKSSEAMQNSSQLTEKYTASVKNLGSLFDETRKNSVVERRSVDGLTETVFGLVDAYQEQILEFLLGNEATENQLARSGINICVLSIIMGRHLGLNQTKLQNVAIAALLHDIGMVRIPAEIMEKTGTLTDMELKAVRSHPLYSYKIIVNDLLYPEEVGTIALQHHERWDGSGYPNKVLGKDIILGARIIAIADAYEAMISRKSYRGSMIGYHAMKSLLGDNARRFDPDVLKSFIQCMGLYPVGSLVLLNDSSVARVIEGHNEAPLRPKIRILIDEFGNSFSGNSGSIIDLLKNRTYFIARALDPKEYRSS